MLAKKSLGQNWLKSETALSTIVDAGDIHADDIVLEIGPGQGALTEKMLKLAGKIIAIEKDHRLIAELAAKFAPEIKAGKLDLIEGDILDFDPGILDFYDRRYKLIANIPYYITGQILKKFLSATCQPKLMVLMVQKEVAKRIVASDEKESILSISVKAYGEPEYIKTVPSGAFIPPPKVDSAILLIDKISKKNFQKIGEQKFFELVKKGFGQKRKKLSSNLGLKPEVLTSCGIGDNARAEELSLNHWLCLAQK